MNRQPFQWKLYSSESYFSFPIKRHLSSEIVLNQRSSSIKSHFPCHLLTSTAFHKRLSYIKGHLPSKFVFHEKSSSINVCLPSKFVFCQCLLLFCCIIKTGCSRGIFFTEPKSIFGIRKFAQAKYKISSSPLMTERSV